MKYFQRIKESWQLTAEEKNEIKRKRDWVRLVDERMFIDVSNVPWEFIEKANEYENRLKEIYKIIKRRRISALLGR